MTETEAIPVEYEEEILVLKSIFNEDFVSMNDDDLLRFDLIIRFPKKIRLIDEAANTSVELAYLPPMTLQMNFKAIYPPDYCLQCDYLSSNQLYQIANQMDAMYQIGEAIVYTWIEFLRDYFEQNNHQLILSSMEESSRNDPRFVTDYQKIGSKRIYEQLIEYDRIQSQLQFDQTIQSCPICLEEKSGKVCLRFENCSHHGCLACLHIYAKEYLANMQEKKQITCYQCDRYLTLAELRRIFSDEKFFLRYQRLLIDMIDCPRCYRSIVCVPSESRSGNHPSFVECLFCQFMFCRRCDECWHPQIQCPKEKIVRNFIENPEQHSTQLNQIELKKLLLEIESIQTIEQCSKPCPSCAVRIEKNGGCQHMNCRACKIHFCWICGWYGGGYVPHPCVPKAEIVTAPPTEDTEEPIFFDEQGQIIQNKSINRVRMCPRPFCREVHVKIGTKNMILCGKCQKYFCFLCGEPVYGLFHYSDYGCKANTSV